MSLNGRQSLTELSVICIIAEDGKAYWPAMLSHWDLSESHKMSQEGTAMGNQERSRSQTRGQCCAVIRHTITDSTCSNPTSSNMVFSLYVCYLV